MADDVLLNKAATIERCVARAGWIDTPLAEALQRMVGYRNIAVHDYQTLQLPITIAVIERHLGDFLAFSRAVLRRQAE